MLLLCLWCRHVRVSTKSAAWVVVGLRGVWGFLGVKIAIKWGWKNKLTFYYMSVTFFSPEGRSPWILILSSNEYALSSFVTGGEYSSCISLSMLLVKMCQQDRFLEYIDSSLHTVIISTLGIKLIIYVLPHMIVSHLIFINVVLLVAGESFSQFISRKDGLS